MLSHSDANQAYIYLISLPSIHSASGQRKLLVIDGPGSEVHGHAYQADPQRYVNEIAAFLKDAL